MQMLHRRLHGPACAVTQHHNQRHIQFRHSIFNASLHHHARAVHNISRHANHKNVAHAGVKENLRRHARIRTTHNNRLRILRLGQRLKILRPPARRLRLPLHKSRIPLHQPLQRRIRINRFSAGLICAPRAKHVVRHRQSDSRRKTRGCTCTDQKISPRTFHVHPSIHNRPRWIFVRNCRRLSTGGTDSASNFMEGCLTFQVRLDVVRAQRCCVSCPRGCSASRCPLRFTVAADADRDRRTITLESIQKLPDQPRMAKRIHHRSLQHPSNRLRPLRIVVVLPDLAPERRSRRYSLRLHRNRIVHKHLNPHRRKSCRQRPASPKLRRLRRQEKPRATHRQSGNHVFIATYRPIQLCPECFLVKFHGSLRVAHRQHHRNFSCHLSSRNHCQSSSSIPEPLLNVVRNPAGGCRTLSF